ncbi:MAG: arginine--tRNA ligase [Bacilli bacterium]|nr:arginine--tRNA ligase [Bacilli bacterium]
MKEKLKETIYNYFNGLVDKDLIKIEYPKDKTLGDYAIPCFQFAKVLKKSPNDIANELLENTDIKGTVLNGYLNIELNRLEYTKDLIKEINNKRNNYGNNNLGANKKIVIEYSSPNIAKPFGVGHLRSTVIGEALKHLAIKCGYDVTTINYLGDYGTQFGKLIYAYKRWGIEENMNTSVVNELKRVYVKFHEEAELDPSLDDEGRKWFKKLEDNDPEALKYFEWFRAESIKEFEKTYNLLKINKFDSYEGEAYYKDKMQPVIDELEQKGLLTISDGATIVDFGDDKPALIKRSDGASLYITRDIAALLDRKNRYNFDEILYVVGNEQALHFEQMKKIVSLMGYDFADDVKHINFGMVLQDGKKMSTRAGKSVILQDVLNEAIDKVKEHITNKENLEIDANEVSRIIGVGAVIFNDLKNYRTNDIEFNLNDILKYEGNTGPYIQYTYARIQSLLKNKNEAPFNIDDYELLNINDNIWNIVWQLYKFEENIINAKNNNDPSIIAKYALDLANLFNKLYAFEKIVDENENYSQFKLEICNITAIVLKESLSLLNIETINQM